MWAFKRARRFASRTYRAPIVVNATGAWGGDLAASVGEPVPVSARGLQMLVTEPVAPFVSAVIGTEGRRLSLKQSLSGHVIIGGGFEGPVDAKRRVSRPLSHNIAKSAANAVQLFVHLRDRRMVRSWSGIEGGTADHLPILGPSATTPGLIHAFGFSAHGFALAPLIGQLVLGIMTGKTAPVPLAPFQISRLQDHKESVDA